MHNSIFGLLLLNFLGELGNLGDKWSNVFATLQFISGCIPVNAPYFLPIIIIALPITQKQEGK